MSSTICQLPQEGKDEHYRLLVEWSTNNFKIVVLHNGSAWSGQASCSHVEQLSTLLQLTIEDYINETKTALSTPRGAENFTYLIENNQFVWKKVDRSSNMKLKYGYVDLEKAPFNDIAEKMLDLLFWQCSNLKTDAVRLQKANGTTVRERHVLMEQLVEYKKQKIQMEQALLGQFLAVLTSKKEYIQELEDALAANNIQSTSSTVPKNNELCTKVQDINPNHYDSDTEADSTDDEVQDLPTKAQDASPNCHDSDIEAHNSNDKDRVQEMSLSANNLFDDVTVPVSTIPKRATHFKRIPKRDVPKIMAGPSPRKVTKLDSHCTGDEGIDKSSTQDLLDDF